ncbi:MAG: hypothetical protein ACYTBV_13010 [Planctomycetota bacterium]|jgi:hypothetical protein
MKTHLTEKELIEYRFKLTSDAEAQQYAQHLESCDRCAIHLEKLTLKFSSLDLLKEDVTASDELLSKVSAMAAQPVRTRISFKFPAWIGSAAAVVLIGSLLLVSMLNTDRRNASVVKSEYVAQEEKVVLGIAETSKDRTAGLFDTDIAAETIPEKPPFAPASAIELNVLPRRDNVQITIYNSADLTLVRETRKLTLKKGWNWLQFMWANTLIDPTSLALEPKAQADKIDIQQLVFPARLRELGRWLIRSQVEGKIPFEITYFTSGLHWRAFYMGTLDTDERKMKLQGYVRVDNNSGEEYENAQTRLIVGKVHQLDKIAELAKRQYPYGSPIPFPEAERGLKLHWDDKSRLGKDEFFSIGGRFGMAGGVEIMADFKPKEIIKEGLSEYFLYTIEGTETIPNKWGKRLMSFDISGIDVNSLYKYDEQRWGAQTIRFVSFKNDDKHNLGDTPIPDGSVKIYSRTEQRPFIRRWYEYQIHPCQRTSRAKSPPGKAR